MSRKECSLSDFVRLPYVIEKDNDFSKALNSCLEKYKKWVKVFLKEDEEIVSTISNADKKDIIKSISTDCGIIKNCVKLYYGGNIAYASRRIKGLIERIIKIDPIGFIKADIDKSYGCRLTACYPELYNNTEGNGLGLSIVKNAVDLQGYIMNITTDNKKFTVLIHF